MTTHALPEDKEKVPRILLRSLGLLLVATTALVAVARWTGMEPAAMPPDVPVVGERVIHLFGDASGRAQVLDPTGSVIFNADPDTGGFIAGVSRSLERQRNQAGIDPAAPVRLVKFADGRLGLRDDYTGWRVELIGFGRDNTAAFERLFNAR